MTHRRSRQLDRAVREYQRENPGITREQARAAVAARTSQAPARLPSAPRPRPGEALPGYIQRVAAALGVQRHRAMELLGLQPGASATRRLDELSGSLPDHSVRALVAATGMTPAQARALTAPLPARPDLDAVRRITEANFAAGHFRRGGAGKTSTSLDLTAVSLALAQRANMIDLDSPGAPSETGTDPRELARLLAETSTRPLLIDTDPPATSHRPLAPLLLGDTSSPFIGQPLLAQYPAGPDRVDEILTGLGTGQGADAAATPRE